MDVISGCGVFWVVAARDEGLWGMNMRDSQIFRLQSGLQELDDLYLILFTPCMFTITSKNTNTCTNL
jgi:hypothetical protein